MTPSIDRTGEWKMKSFKDFLPTPKKKSPPKGIMVRPPKEISAWLYELAVKHNVSVNKIVVSILLEKKANSNEN